MEKQLRVLCVFSKLDRGGAETMCMNFYREIDRTKIQFDFVKHTSEKGSYEDEILSLGGRIFEAPRYKGYNRVTYCRWWKKHLQQHPEHQIIHGHFFSISAVYFKIAKSMGRVTIGHSHSTKCSGSVIKRMMKKSMVRKAPTYTDVALACSQDAGEWMFPKMEYKVLHNAISLESFRYNSKQRELLRKQLGIETDELTIGTVGRLSKVKNPFFLLDVIKNTRILCPKMKFLWVGDGELREPIERKLQEENLQDTVIMTGLRSDIYDLLQAMDVFVLPSLWEGLPMVMIEAQAAGLPCLCSNGVPKEGAILPNCRFLEIEAPDVWAEEILRMDLTRSDTMEQIAAAGFDIKQEVKSLEGIYLECAKR